MSLADYWEGGGAYLKAGVHVVTVKSFRMFKYNSGSDGVEFTLETAATAGGGQSKVSFNLLPKSLEYGSLASFARACGLSKEGAANYDPTPPNKTGHQMLVGQQLKVRIIKHGEYHEVDDDFGWAKVAEELAAPTIDRSAEMKQSPVQSGTPF